MASVLRSTFLAENRNCNNGAVCSGTAAKSPVTSDPPRSPCWGRPKPHQLQPSRGTGVPLQPQLELRDLGAYWHNNEIVLRYGEVSSEDCSLSSVLTMEKVVSSENWNVPRPT